jgi:prepilin-type N-terminal cleavage/methylation domain-containing protein
MYRHPAADALSLGISGIRTSNKVHTKGGKVPMNVQQKEKGFTIIEVVLVLAIAGLIFLMVFLALPALQSSQRDGARKTDAGTIASAITNFSSNNRGATPTTAQLVQYVKGLSDNTTSTAAPSSPSTGTVTGLWVQTLSLTGTATATVSPTDSSAIVSFGTKCSTVSGTGYVVGSGTKRQFTVVMKVEAGGGTWYCQDS